MALKRHLQEKVAKSGHARCIHKSASLILDYVRFVIWISSHWKQGIAMAACAKSLSVMKPPHYSTFALVLYCVRQLKLTLNCSGKLITMSAALSPLLHAWAVGLIDSSPTSPARRSVRETPLLKFTARKSMWPNRNLFKQFNPSLLPPLPLCEKFAPVF